MKLWTQCLHATSRVTMCTSGARVWSVMFVYIDVRDYACTSIAAISNTRRQEQSSPSPPARQSHRRSTVRCQVITQEGKMHGKIDSAVSASAPAVCLPGRVHYSPRGELRNLPLLLWYDRLTQSSLYIRVKQALTGDTYFCVWIIIVTVQSRVVLILSVH